MLFLHALNNVNINSLIKVHSHLVLRTLVLKSPNTQASHLGPKPIYLEDFNVKFNIHLILINHPFNIGCHLRCHLDFHLTLLT
jgi:hypothetical protein